MGSEPDTESLPVELRPTSLEEAIAMAILLQRNGQLDDAEKFYREILRLAPDHPDALHYAGVLAHQQGRSEEGLALIQRSLLVAPNCSDCYSNLGIIFKALGRLDEGIAAYRQAIALNPDHGNAHNNLGILLRARQQPAEAEAAYRTAIRLNPEHAEAYHNLGILLAGEKRTQEAVVCYCKVVTLVPGHTESRRLLALAYCTLGQQDKAVEIFERWLKDEPDHVVARHMLAACSGRDVPARACDGFVETTFDGFAASFEAQLARLSYRAPTLVAAMLSDAGVPACKALDVLDAGCGTGLCGPLVAPYARRLVGVDLSRGMLGLAGEKGVYDELAYGELTAFLRDRPESFDVIVSADTLVYFGALEEAVSAAASALRPGGFLIFTVEEACDPSDLGDFCIKPHGRYNHQFTYVRDVLLGAGLTPELVRAELRMECGVPVKGLVVSGVKPGAQLTGEDRG